MALKIWLPLTQDLRNLGTENVEISNTGATLDDNGKIGKCYNFDENDTNGQYMTISPYSLNNSWGISAWVYPVRNYPSIHQWIIAFNVSNASDFRFALYLYQNVFGVRFNGITDYNTSQTISLNTWYHIAVSYNGSKIEIYINGELVQSGNYVISNYNPTDIYIGCRKGQAGYFGGKLNDIRIYDHCLSAAEVKEISRGLVRHYKLSDNNTNLYDFQAIANKWVTEGVTKADYIDPQYGNVLKITTSVANKRIYRSVSNIWTQGQVYTVSFLAKAETNGTVVNMSRSIADFTLNFTLTTDWKWYSGKITSTATADAGTLSFKIVSSSGTVYLTNVKLEKGEIATPYTPGPGDPLYTALGYNSNSIIDNSGVNNNNGIITGTLTSSSDTSRYSSSVVFSGSQRIEADSLPSETQTISFWIKTNYGSATEIIFVDKNTGLACGFYNKNFITICGSSNGSTGSVAALGDKYITNQWNHIVIIKTGDKTRKTYINGQLAGNNGNNYWTMTLNNLLMGCRYNGAYQYYFNGQLSDFRAYATELSEADVLELYQMGAKIDSENKFHTYELVEDSSTIKINKKGQLQINELNETTGINFDSTKDLNANELIEI